MMATGRSDPPNGSHHWPRRLGEAVFVALLLALPVGLSLVVIGALLAWATDQSTASLTIAGIGVLLAFIGAIARGYFP